MTVDGRDIRLLIDFLKLSWFAIRHHGIQRFQRVTDPSAGSPSWISDWSVLAIRDRSLRGFLAAESWLFNEETYASDIIHCFLDCYLLSIFRERRGKTEFLFIQLLAVE